MQATYIIISSNHIKKVKESGKLVLITCYFIYLTLYYPHVSEILSYKIMDEDLKSGVYFKLRVDLSSP